MPEDVTINCTRRKVFVCPIDVFVSFFFQGNTQTRGRVKLTRWAIIDFLNYALLFILFKIFI
jgi:hypothetical protein